MACALDIANFFIDLANNDPDEGMTNMRVNKLVYFANAWALVRLGRPLFDDEIQAWTFGPVIPAVYDAFKICGKERIHETAGNYSHSLLTTEETDLLLDVANEYGQYSTSRLVNITHKPGSPWSETFRRHENAVIDNTIIQAYFKNLPPLPSFVFPDPADDEYEGYRDPADGLLVLPGELNDE